MLIKNIFAVCICIWGAKSLILYSLQELVWRLCFSISWATCPPMLVVHLHKEYFHYFRGFGWLLSKGTCPREFHRIVQCEWEALWSSRSPFPGRGLSLEQTHMDSFPCNLQLPCGPGVASAAVPQIKALTDPVSPLLSLTITKLTFYNEEELPTLALMEILNTFNIYIYIWKVFEQCFVFFYTTFSQIEKFWLLLLWIPVHL